MTLSRRIGIKGREYGEKINQSGSEVHVGCQKTESGIHFDASKVVPLARDLNQCGLLLISS